MGKNSGGQEINNANGYYQQMGNEANSMFGQFNQLDLPALQSLFPELQQALQGQGPLASAAQAPVNANTSRSLNTMQNNLGGVANPNALYSDIALQGQQQAGLASDNMLGSSLSALQGLIGQGYGGVNTGSNALGNAASGSANLGLQLNNQSNQMWQSLLGAAGTYAGMSMGIPPGVSSAASSAILGGGGSGASSLPFGAGIPGMGIGGTFYGAAASPGTSSSAPISSGG